MAGYDLLTIQGGRNKRQPSASTTLDLTSVRIGADTLAIAQTGSGGSAAFDFSSRKLANIADPTSPQHAATKAYVDAVALGLSPKTAVRAASVGANVVIASGLINGTVLDTVTLATGDRVLLKDQSLPEENGIYIVAVSGAASRSTDMDSLSPIDEVNGAYTFIQSGSQGGQGWVEVSKVTTLGVDPMTWAYFNNVASLVGGDMIALTGSTISVDLASASGLVSTNPGNNAGQLTINLESSNPTLHIATNQLGVKLDAAGAIVTGASGILVQLESSNPTLQISSNRLGVKLDSAGALSTGTGGVKVNAGTAINLTGNNVNVDFTKDYTNDNAGSITVGQLVYVKANGNVDLAIAQTVSDSFAVGVVAATSIATTASGAITVRRGAILSGFSSLTIGAPVYISRTTAGAVTQSLAGFVAGEFVYRVGRADSATTIVFDPQFDYEF